jgi:hypothetical protein
VSGNINNVRIDDQDVHAYVHTLPSDARNYVAIGRLGKEIGKKLTLALPFATSIHWLFAGDTNPTSLNGFLLTGTLF